MKTPTPAALKKNPNLSFKDKAIRASNVASVCVKFNDESEFIVYYSLPGRVSINTRNSMSMTFVGVPFRSGPPYGERLDGLPSTTKARKRSGR